MSFVKLENLNDFIEPSSACIKPMEKKTVGVVAKVKDINLSDCLACSGCITSAETVLVQQQTHEELFTVINDSKSSKVITNNSFSTGGNYNCGNFLLTLDPSFTLLNISDT
jgi:iron only hydrogenase large subunit-like protein